jgi:ATP-dependent Clp protease ATP-binding subunit ClpA
LWDEIEKASDALWNILLGILDKGVITLGTNEQVDMTRCLIIMTSNVGQKELARMAGDEQIGFNQHDEETVMHLQGKFEEVALAALRRKFSPEFINRIDDIVMFKTLTKGEILNIVDLEIDKLTEILVRNDKFISLRPSPAAKKELMREGYDKKYNARNLKRTIEQRIVFPMASMLDSKEITSGDIVVIDFVNGEWSYWAEPSPLVVEKISDTNFKLPLIPTSDEYAQYIKEVTNKRYLDERWKRMGIDGHGDSKKG